jgi:hypothetical protein
MLVALAALATLADDACPGHGTGRSTTAHATDRDSLMALAQGRALWGEGHPGNIGPSTRSRSRRGARTSTAFPNKPVTPGEGWK